SLRLLHKIPCSNDVRPAARSSPPRGALSVLPVAPGPLGPVSAQPRREEQQLTQSAHRLQFRLRFGAIACAAALLAVACKSSSTTPTKASSSSSCSSSAPGGTLGGDCDIRTPSLKLTGAGANSI